MLQKPGVEEVEKSPKMISFGWHGGKLRVCRVFLKGQ
jgi:hypothetical protein